MPTRSIVIDGDRWEVSHSGRVTQLDRDEFTLVFSRRHDGGHEMRVVRYSPQGARWRDQSLAELSDADLARLFSYSQASATSPDVGYRA
jgi:hypothetical protein